MINTFIIANKVSDKLNIKNKGRTKVNCQPIKNKIKQINVNIKG